MPYPSTGKALKVLVAEDNIINQRLVIAMLTALGHTGVVVGDGAKALKCLSKLQFDAVLMDCRLPGRDGYATTREIRAREKERGGAEHLVIIAVTGSVQPEDRQRCLEAGMDAVLAKPFTFEALRSCLAPWLGRGGT